LLTRFRAFWSAVAEPGDQPSPFLPFFHMRSEPFWTLHAHPGQEAVLQAMRRIGGMAEARNIIEYASLTKLPGRGCKIRCLSRRRLGC